MIDNKSLKFIQSTDVDNGASLFAFDNIFDEQSTQHQIYESTAKPIIDSNQIVCSSILSIQVFLMDIMVRF